MDFYEYPLLNVPELMLTVLKVASRRTAGLQDCVAQLQRNLRRAKENPPVSETEMRGHLALTVRDLTAALLLEPVDGDRFRITGRGRRVLADHPCGIDETVLMEFPEYRAFVHRPRPQEDLRISEYDEGYAAYRAGMGPADNPYEPDTAKHLEWQNGWSEARDSAADHARPWNAPAGFSPR